MSEPNKGTWHVEEQEIFYGIDGEVFITVDREEYLITKDWVVSLNKDLVCGFYYLNILNKSYKMNHEINFK